MPPSLRVELQIPNTDEWTRLNDIRLGDRDGTVSDNHETGRDVFLFGVDPIENQGYVKKSVLGVDATESSTRMVSSAGFVTIAALETGESYELTVHTDKSPEPRRLRFTYFED